MKKFLRICGFAFLGAFLGFILAIIIITLFSSNVGEDLGDLVLILTVIPICVLGGLIYGIFISFKR